VTATATLRVTGDEGAAPPAGALASPERLKFEPDSGFYAQLKDEADAYFARTGLSPKDAPALYRKTAIIFAWFLSSYLYLVFGANTWWQAGLAAVSLGLSVSGIGFAIQHDANHHAYSKQRWVNGLLGFSLDVVGGSSYIWRYKHNVFHHTFPNLAGADDDIDLRPFARLAPAQPRRSLHRFQQYYMWALYGFLAPKWHFVDDYKNLINGRIGPHRLPRPRGAAMVAFFGFKLFFMTWAFVVPMFFHPWWMVLGGYALAAGVTGTSLAIVFQLAHCVDGADFPAPPEGQSIGMPFAEHQVRTSVDFADGNRLLTWYLGGLNYQVVHHLFPHVCHAHYPALAKVVAKVCEERGVRYRHEPTLSGALAAHFRWLRQMGEA
jgi:linoleoyl-CoA desaturase